MPRPREIAVAFQNPERFLQFFELRGAAGTLFVATDQFAEIAEQVFVRVEFPSQDRFFRLHGKVVSRRRSFVEPELPPGLEVEFLISEKRTVQLCIDHAEGKNIDFVHRDSRRVPCYFDVVCHADNQRTLEKAEDISEGGIFLRTERMFPVGCELQCQLRPHGYLWKPRVQSKVIWHQRLGQRQGLGVAFLFVSERERKKIADLVKKLASGHSLEFNGKTL